MGNNITKNAAGIWLCDAFRNRIINNNLMDNRDVAMMLWDSKNNTVYHNNFIGNGDTVWLDNSAENFWDNGYPSGGNYWSDYTGVDSYSGPYQNETGSDGIGDIPYVIDNNNVDRYPLMEPWIPPDIAVVEVLPSVTEVYEGETVNITVTVRNEATTILEAFNITVYYNDTVIGTQTIFNLCPGENVTLTFSWNTKGVVHGNYLIRASATTLPDEANVENNVMISSLKVRVKMLGDVNGDNKVDIRDISMAASAFGSYPNSLRWIPQADVNKDNRIDIIDIALIAINFGKSDL